MAKSEAGLRDFTRWRKGLSDLREAMKANDPELRLRLRAHLRELIDTIEVFAVGFPKRYDPDEEERALENVPKRERWKARAEYLGTVESFAEQVDALCEKAYLDSTLRKGPRLEGGKLRLSDEARAFYRFLDHVTDRRMSVVVTSGSVGG